MHLRRAATHELWTSLSAKFANCWKNRYFVLDANFVCVANKEAKECHKG